MLLDVMPTILTLCGIEVPPHGEGTDLSPLWRGDSLPPVYRLINHLAEVL